MYPIILNIVYLVIVAIYLNALLTNKWHQALLILFFSIPLKHIYMTFGGHYLELWKILSLLSVPVTFGYFLKLYPKIFLLKLLLIYFFIAIVSGLIGPFMTELLPNVEVVNFSLKVFISQLVQLLAFLNLILIPLVLSLRKGDVLRQAIVVYIATMTGLALLGLFQYFVFTSAGINIFPIPRMDGSFQEDVMLHAMKGVGISESFRVTSLSMEPKNLSLYLCAGIIFLLELRRSLERAIFGKVADVVALLLMLSCMALTFSTLGFVALALYFMFVALNPRRVVMFGIFIVVVIVPLTFTELGRYVTEMLDIRLFNRIEGSGGLEDFDLGTFDFLLYNPEFIFTGVGFGNIHIVADSYLPSFAQWASGSRWHAKMGGLYVLAGTGIFGLFLLVALFLSGLRCAVKAKGHELSMFAYTITLFFTLFYFVRLTEFTFLALGIALAVYVHTKKGVRSIKIPQWKRFLPIHR